MSRFKKPGFLKVFERPEEKDNSPLLFSSSVAGDIFLDDPSELDLVPPTEEAAAAPAASSPAAAREEQQEEEGEMTSQHQDSSSDLLSNIVGGKRNRRNQPLADDHNPHIGELPSSVKKSLEEQTARKKAEEQAGKSSGSRKNSEREQPPHSQLDTTPGGGAKRKSMSKALTNRLSKGRANHKKLADAEEEEEPVGPVLTPEIEAALSVDSDDVADEENGGDAGPASSSAVTEKRPRRATIANLEATVKNVRSGDHNSSFAQFNLGALPSPRRQGSFLEEIHEHEEEEHEDGKEGNEHPHAPRSTASADVTPAGTEFGESWRESSPNDASGSDSKTRSRMGRSNRQRSVGRRLQAESAAAAAPTGAESTNPHLIHSRHPHAREPESRDTGDVDLDPSDDAAPPGTEFGESSTNDASGSEGKTRSRGSRSSRHRSVGRKSPADSAAAATGVESTSPHLVHPRQRAAAAAEGPDAPEPESIGSADADLDPSSQLVLQPSPTRRSLTAFSKSLSSRILGKKERNPAADYIPTPAMNAIREMGNSDSSLRPPSDNELDISDDGDEPAVPSTPQQVNKRLAGMITPKRMMGLMKKAMSDRALFGTPKKDGPSLEIYSSPVKRTSSDNVGVLQPIDEASGITGTDSMHRGDPREKESADNFEKQERRRDDAREKDSADSPGKRERRREPKHHRQGENQSRERSGKEARRKSTVPRSSSGKRREGKSPTRTVRTRPTEDHYVMETTWQRSPVKKSPKSTTTMVSAPASTAAIFESPDAAANAKRRLSRSPKPSPKPSITDSDIDSKQSPRSEEFKELPVEPPLTEPLTTTRRSDSSRVSPHRDEAAHRPSRRRHSLGARNAGVGEGVKSPTKQPKEKLSGSSATSTVLKSKASERDNRGYVSPRSRMRKSLRIHHDSMSKSPVTQETKVSAKLAAALTAPSLADNSNHEGHESGQDGTTVESGEYEGALPLDLSETLDMGKNESVEAQDSAPHLELPVAESMKESSISQESSEGQVVKEESVDGAKTSENSEQSSNLSGDTDMPRNGERREISDMVEPGGALSREDVVVTDPSLIEGPSAQLKEMDLALDEVPFVSAFGNYPKPVDETDNLLKMITEEYSVVVRNLAESKARLEARKMEVANLEKEVERLQYVLNKLYKADTRVLGPFPRCTLKKAS